MFAATRPDPDLLLAQVQEQERRAQRGKLRIYFGASAGVGKTWAMLAAARKLQDEGCKVLLGVVETHGRAETAALVQGLPCLPLKNISYRERQLQEFDLDAALAARPDLILVDELAHSNAPTSRHPKRWQDVLELLAAGMDVFTSLNVQHLESLHDVVGGITGIRVAETVPDTVFDQADEVILVDLPADELLNRLQSGKVYQAGQAERALQHFFRKGNLIALRELALRRTADRVQGDVQAYRIEQSIGKVWKTDANLLLCMGPGQSAEHVVRSGARLASQLNTGWHVLYVETPPLQRQGAQARARILKNLKLAEDLGAKTALVQAADIAGQLVQYAHTHNCAKIILGRSRPHTWLRRFEPGLQQQIARLAPELDVVELGRSHPHTPHGTAPEPVEKPLRHWRHAWRGHLEALLATVFTTLVASPLLPYFELSNIVMLFLLNVVLLAARHGRGAAISATVLGVAAFDFFFVQPRFSFAVSDVQYLLTFAVMLGVGLLTAHLTARLQFQAHVAALREGRATALYQYARELSGCLQAVQIFDMTRDLLSSSFRARACLLLPDADGRLQALPANEGEEPERAPALGGIALDMGIAQWAFERARCAGTGTDTLPASPLFYLPLVAPMRTRGVLVLLPDSGEWITLPEQRQQLETFARLAAIALERVHYIEVAQDALLKMESERLRNSLLAALSHDLRTPLTSVVGLAESLARSQPLHAQQQEFAQALYKETLRLSNMVANLLDMARIQSGDVKLNKQWQPLDEVIGSALHASQSLLQQHQVQVQMNQGLLLLHFDAVLLERVLCNLLENASKYTPPGSCITLSTARVQQAGRDMLEVTVADNGPGLPPGKEDAIFEKFTRGERESSTPGVGLGLAICRAIIEAHGGKIAGRRSEQGGAAFVFTLPLETAPDLSALPE